MDKGGKLGREHYGRHSRQSRWWCELGGQQGRWREVNQGGKGAVREKRNDLYGDTHGYQHN